jgi:hypothetical protein
VSLAFEERVSGQWWRGGCNLVLISNCREIVVWKRRAYFLCAEDRTSGDLFSRYNLQDAMDASSVSPWFVLFQLACELGR